MGKDNRDKAIRAQGNVAVQTRPQGHVTQIRQVTIESILPPPDVLNGWETICPGTTNRLIAMAEHNNIARSQREDKAISLTFSEAKRGQIFALLIAVAGLLTAAYLGFLGQQIAASVASGTVLVQLVGLFLKRRQESDKKE